MKQLAFIVFSMFIGSHAFAQESDQTTLGISLSPASDVKTTSEKIDKSLSESQKTKDETEKSQQKAKIDLQQARTANERDSASTLLTIETYRANLAKHSVQWFSDLKKIVDKYDTIEQKAQKTKGALRNNQNISKEQALILYSEAKQQWRTLIDDGSAVYHMVFDQSNLDKINQNFDALNLSELEPEAKAAAQTALSQATAEKKSFKIQQRDKIKARFDDFYKLLAKTSAVRSKALNVVSSKNISFFEANDDFFGDLSREVRAMPFRFFGVFFQRYLEIQSSLSQGFSGIWKIAKNAFSLIVIFLIPFFAASTTKKILKLVDQYRTSLLRRRRSRDKNALAKALWIQRLTPYIPWILYALFLKLLSNILTDTIFNELKIIIPIFFYIIAYKIFRILLSDAMQSLRTIANINDKSTKKLIDSTAKMVGYFFLYSFIIMHLTKATVDEGILYRLIENLMYLIGFFITFAAAMRWKSYVVPAAKTILSPKLAAFLSKKCEGMLAFFFVLPTFLIVLLKVFGNSLWGFLAEFEFMKRLLAKVYRKKIESLVGEQKIPVYQKPQSDYTDLFAITMFNEGLRVDANSKAYQAVKGEIDTWLENKEEDQSLAIYGEKGVGKSFLLNSLADEYQNLNVLKLKIPPKLCTKESLNDFFAESFGVEKTGTLLKNVLEYNNKIDKKTLVLVDDTHNLFLGKFGGFEAFHSYIDVVNLKTENLFWCSVFNEYSWAYLKGVLGSAQYLRTEIKVENWSDEEIKELVLKRHKQSNFSLSYDQMILASSSGIRRAEAINQAEEQFFRLLWEQSNGNPRVALHLWINCISQKSGKTLHVTLPEQAKTGKLGLLNDDAWFVIAAIARHENLTRSEASTITSLNWAQVAHAIKLALENKLIFRGVDNRYRLHFNYQYDLIRQLKMKNFIYGIE